MRLRRGALTSHRAIVLGVGLFVALTVGWAAMGQWEDARRTGEIAVALWLGFALGQLDRDERVLKPDA
jgi:hypothetical protein